MATSVDERMAALPPAKAANWLLWTIVAIFIVGLIWAFFARLDTTVRGQGKVVTSSQLQVVSNLEGGVVETIFVKPGDMVKSGAPLVALDQTETGANLFVNEAGSAALVAKIARLQAEVAGKPPQFPSGGPQLLQSQVEIEKALYVSRQADLNGLSYAGAARIAQAQRAVSEAQAMLAARQQSAIAAVRERDLLRPLVERGIEPRLSLVQAESRAATSQAEVAAAGASVNRAQAAVGEAQATRVQQIQDWRAKAADDLATAQRDLAAQRGAEPALKERLERTMVRAPMDGRINRVLKSTVGGTVSPREPLVEIVPSDDALFVEARVRPQDIGWVALGQRAKVEITAYDPAIYGGLEAEVVTIAPDAQTDERTGEPYYVVQVRTKSDVFKDKTGKDLRIGPGMIAQVFLIGEKRSVLEYILRPITRVGDRALRE